MRVADSLHAGAEEATVRETDTQDTLASPHAPYPGAAFPQ